MGFLNKMIMEPSVKYVQEASEDFTKVILLLLLSSLLLPCLTIFRPPLFPPSVSSLIAPPKLAPVVPVILFTVALLPMVPGWPLLLVVSCARRGGREGERKKKKIRR